MEIDVTSEFNFLILRLIRETKFGVKNYNWNRIQRKLTTLSWFSVHLALILMYSLSSKTNNIVLLYLKLSYFFMYSFFIM